MFLWRHSGGYWDPATAFHRCITMVIVSTLSAFLAVLVTFLPQ